MASSTAKSLRFLTVIMVSVFMFVSSSESTIGEVCNKAMDQKFCLSSLNPYPEALNANISRLAVITANISLMEMIKVREFIVGLNRSEGQGNRRVLAVLEECIEFYENGQRLILQSLSILKKPDDADGDFVNVLQSGALTNVNACLDEMNQTAPKLAPVVEKRSQNLGKMIDDALSATNLLFQIGS